MRGDSSGDRETEEWWKAGRENTDKKKKIRGGCLNTDGGGGGGRGDKGKVKETNKGRNTTDEIFDSTR